MNVPSDIELALRLGTALAIGLVVGVERGWRERDAAAGSRTAGVRTYTLAGLLGGIFGAATLQLQSAWLIGLGFLGFAFVFALFKFREAIHDDEFSVTGVIAALVVYILGAYAVIGSVEVAAGAGAVLAGVLASREMLHGFLARLTWTELRSALIIVGMSAIVLPLLPNRAIDPFGGINPFEIWLFAILTAAISYSGYVAIKVLPPQRGITVAAMTGALVSSTAVTLDLARRSREGDGELPFAGGACLAAMVSTLRVLALVMILRPLLAVQLMPAIMATATLFGLIGTALLWRSGQNRTESAITPGNPFEMIPVLTFASLFAAVSFTAALLGHLYGSRGLLAAVGVAAIADVDAAALSAMRLAGTSTLSADTAAAILIAIAVNALTRALSAIAIGQRSFGLLLGGATITALLAGAAARVLLPI
jgi:uncharacterized membrane protein (DUF4010 family)